MAGKGRGAPAEAVGIPSAGVLHFANESADKIMTVTTWLGSHAMTEEHPGATTSESETPEQPASAAGRPERRKPTDRRRSAVDRRLGLDRRRGPGRRRSDDRRAAEEGEMTDEQFEFLMVIDKYKRVNNRPFPSWTEVLDLVHALGYRRVAEPEDLK